MTEAQAQEEARRHESKGIKKKFKKTKKGKPNNIWGIIKLLFVLFWGKYSDIPLNFFFHVLFLVPPLGVIYLEVMYMATWVVALGFYFIFYFGEFYSYINSLI